MANSARKFLLSISVLLSNFFVDVAFDGNAFAITAPVTVSIVGNGQVVSNKISCPGNCTADLDYFSLSAIAPEGSKLIRWEGCAQSSFSNCSGYVYGPTEIVAVFANTNEKKLSLKINGRDNEKVFANVDVSPDAELTDVVPESRYYPNSTVVTLKAQVNATSIFLGWSGACSGTNPICQVNLDSNKEVQANFGQGEVKKFTMNILGYMNNLVMFEYESDYVSSDHCSYGKCERYFHPGTVLTLRRLPQAEVAEWGGDCSYAGSAPTCTLVMDRDRSATFKAELFNRKNLIVSAYGKGHVEVRGVAAYYQFFSTGEAVEIEAFPSYGSHFVKWDDAGPCAGKGAKCTLHMNADYSFFAKFATNQGIDSDHDSVIDTEDCAPLDSSRSTRLAYPDTDKDGFADSNSLVDTKDCYNSNSDLNGFISAFKYGNKDLCLNHKDLSAFSSTFPPSDYDQDGLGDECDNDPKIRRLSFEADHGDLSFAPEQGKPFGFNLARYTYLVGRSFPDNSLVTVTAIPEQGYRFVEWNGACSGNLSTCTVRLNSDKNIIANFEKISGPDSDNDGFVDSLDCAPLDASLQTQFGYPDFDYDDVPDSLTPVRLNKCIACHLRFENYMAYCELYPSNKDNCPGVSNFTQTDTDADNIGDRCDSKIAKNLLSVNMAGSGLGQVNSTELQLSCPENCEEFASENQTVVLRAQANVGSIFKGWSGACAGTSNVCTLSMNQAKFVTANFEKLPGNVLLSVNITGGGAGLIESDISGINCLGDCTDTYTTGTVVILRATASAGSTFLGWSGACKGIINSCEVTMNQAASVEAKFEETSKSALQVSISGTGSGTVRSNYGTPRIACPGDCAAFYEPYTTIELIAYPSDDSIFAGWNGGCDKIYGDFPGDVCQVSISKLRTVTAIFNSITVPPVLNVSLKGTGSGQVVSSDLNISCPGKCSESYISFPKITLTAKPADSSLFIGWEGACSGSSTSCVVTVNLARDVVAIFDSKPTIDVGSGGGSNNGSDHGPGSNSPSKETPESNSPGTEAAAKRAIRLDFNGDKISDAFIATDLKNNQKQVSVFGVNAAKISNVFLTEKTKSKTKTYLAPADYDGNGVVENAFVRLSGKKLKWSPYMSSPSFILGGKSSRIVSGCYFDSDLKSDAAVIDGSKLKIKLSNSGKIKTIKLPIRKNQSLKSFACGDINSDSIDEINIVTELKNKLEKRIDSQVSVLNIKGEALLQATEKGQLEALIADFDNNGKIETGYIRRNKNKSEIVFFNGNQANIFSIPLVRNFIPAKLKSKNNILVDGMYIINGKNIQTLNFTDLVLNNFLKLEGKQALIGKTLQY